MYGTTTGIAEDVNLDGKINFITAGETGTLYNYAVEWYLKKLLIKVPIFLAFVYVKTTFVRPEYFDLF